MISTLPNEAACLTAAILTSASWNSSGEVSKELPAERRGMCVLTYEARAGGRGLACVVYFQRVLLRMCWEVEELREFSALWFGFHLPGTQLGRGGGEIGCLDISTNIIFVFACLSEIKGNTWSACLCATFRRHFFFSCSLHKKHANNQTEVQENREVKRARRRQLTATSRPFISLFVSSRSNMCSDRDHSQWSALHWLQSVQYVSTGLDLFGYSKLRLSSLAWHHHVHAFHMSQQIMDAKIKMQNF